MIRTALLLIFTFVVVPLVAFYFDDPLTAQQTKVLYDLGLLCLIIALACFVVSELAKNYSQTDKVWSVAPIAYVWLVAAWGDWNSRLVLMAILVTIWGLRLTYNFGRRGGYSWKFWTGEEDYRWAVLRQKPGMEKPWVWRLFNLFFISIYQNGLILFFTLPTVVALAGTDKPLSWVDYLLALLFINFVVIETLADQQQWIYQSEKYRRKGKGEPLEGDYAKGFLDKGLWGIVRHPNYAAEQAIWIVFYFFSVTATGSWLNWSIVGCLLLVVLFKGSSDFSESISADKYPAYKDYQKRVPRFIPKLW